MWLYICSFLLVYNASRCTIVLVLIPLGIKKRDLSDGFTGKWKAGMEGTWEKGTLCRRTENRKKITYANFMLIIIKREGSVEAFGLDLLPFKSKTEISSV